MKLHHNRLITASVRFMTSATLVVALIFATGMALATDKNAQKNQTELRINDMHAKLKITPAQEEQWTKVTQVMLENSKTMDALTQTRFDQAKSMTAIDDLKSYGEIAETHANGIKKLTPVFADLYINMSDTQKKEADILFREGTHPHKDKKGHQKTGGK